MEARRPRRDERGVDDAVTVPVRTAFESALIGSWWVVALRGALNVLFGVLAFAWPAATFVVLVALFGAYAFVNGLFALGAAIFGRTWTGRRWPLVLEGVVGIGAGLVTLFLPGITAVALIALVAIWAIANGVFEIVEAIRLRRVIEGEWLLGLAGLLSVVFGILVVLFPAAGALSIIWLIGAYAIVFGVVLVALGFRLRTVARQARSPG
ncbi:MAG TPA: HdeD family acid-resistance protein [Thermodesulfobacteriota bacterium]